MWKISKQFSLLFLRCINVMKQMRLSLSCKSTCFISETSDCISMKFDARICMKLSRAILFLSVEYKEYFKRSYNRVECVKFFSPQTLFIRDINTILLWSITFACSIFRDGEYTKWPKSQLTWNIFSCYKECSDLNLPDNLQSDITVLWVVHCTWRISFRNC